ncbi:tetratricopeptide repeat-containing sensor histidine kinase [uncultured Lutibacter sp.]|uniref:tetratricopeptide repeat-containing sensor histidine kinase n=1 Tax=uncultured Lutibacter sp. TaxID=437739 RepID=UPI0026341C46|nr:tetratricopeptide repeat-containing sensor histidine kinase [uncultured Lutibacter sp.]
MNTLFKYNLFSGILYICILFTFIFCNNKRPIDDKKIVGEIDSVDSWIQQSKNSKFDLNERTNALQKAFNFSNGVLSDSMKINYYSKIAYEADNLNSEQLFKEVNFKAFSLATKLSDTFKIGDAHWNYASFYNKKEIIDSAYYHYHEAYKNFKLVKHEYFTAKMLYNMGFLQGRLKDYTGSEVLMFEALTIFKKLNKNLSIYHCYNYLGLIYMELEEFDKAIYYHNKALEYLKKVDDKGIFKEWSLNNLGLVYQNLKKYEEAIYSFEKALQNSNLKERNLDFYAILIDNVAYTKFLDGDTTNVVEGFNKSLKIRDSTKYITGLTIVKRHLAEFYATKLDTFKAVQFANEAFGLADQVDNNRDKLESLLLLSKVDTKNSSKYLANYVHLSDSLQIEERKIRNKFTRIRFETDEYIDKTEELSQQKVFISIGAIITLLFLSLAYFLRVQRSKNKELIFEREQQKSNEEIFSLMLKQQSKLEEGRLKERHRISEDLHDGVLGKIFGTRIGLGFLSIKGDENDTKKHQFFIDELQNIEKEIRSISHELKSEVLSSKVDFFKIIENLIEQKSTLGNFEYHMIADEEIYWDKINDEIKINFYRIIQEALQNIIKYANATKVNLKFELENNILKLIINDNGIGFNALEKRRGIGLKNMQSRTNKLNGIFEVSSKINSGTSIFVSCSIQNKNNE